MEAPRQKPCSSDDGWSNAITPLNYTVVTLLERHTIEMSDAVNGEVDGVPNVPGTHEPAK